MLAVNTTAVASLIVSIATAVGVLLTGIGTFRGNQKTTAMHKDIKTSNGTPVGQMIEKAANTVETIASEVGPAIAQGAAAAKEVESASNTPSAPGHTS